MYLIPGFITKAKRTESDAVATTEQELQVNNQT